MSEKRKAAWLEHKQGDNRKFNRRYPEDSGVRNRLRRARLAEVETEDFSAREVFERDGWICQICNEPVDPDLLYPNLQSVSLDHIVPIVRGGGHTRANTQCAHLRCNLVKGAR